MTESTCLLIISIIMVIIITIMCIVAYNNSDRKKLFKAKKIVNLILDDYLLQSNKKLDKESNKKLDKEKDTKLIEKDTKLDKEKDTKLIDKKDEFNLDKLIISRCELIRKLPPTYENYIMLYNGLLNYSKKNDTKIHRLGVLLDVE